MRINAIIEITHYILDISFVGNSFEQHISTVECDVYSYKVRKLDVDVDVKMWDGLVETFYENDFKGIPNIPDSFRGGSSSSNLLRAETERCRNQM